VSNITNGPADDYAASPDAPNAADHEQRGQDLGGITLDEIDFGGITSDEVSTRGRQEGHIDDRVVRTAIRRIEAARVVEFLEECRREDGYNPALGGRPSFFTAKAVITAFFLLALEDSPLEIRKAARLLHHRISPAMRELLDIPEPHAFTTLYQGAVRWEENLRSALRRQVLDVMDPFPARRYEAMTMVEVRDTLLAHDTELEAIRKARLDEFMRRMIRMTYMEQPRRIRRAGKRMDLTIDQTYVEAPTKRGFSRKRLDADVAKELRALQENRALTPGPSDVFVGWYPRTGERPDLRPGVADVTSPDNPGGAAELAWGWVLNLASRVNADMPRKSAFPRIIAAASISMPNVGVSEEAVNLMRAALGNDSNVPGVVDADKAYFANALPERLHEPAFELGYTPSTDYRADRLGNTRPNEKGVVLTDGGMYCPSTPKPLLTAARDLHRGDIDEATFEARRLERRAYQLRAKKRPKPDGTVRMACPALGLSPTVSCPIAKMIADAKPDDSRPHVENPPDFLPAICRQHAITMKRDEYIRDVQAFEHGSPEWRRFHIHARESIESTNKQVKSSNISDFEDSARRQARGFAAAGFFAAVFIAAWNIAKIAAFLHDELVGEADLGSQAHMPTARPRLRDSKWYNSYTGNVPHGKLPPEYIENRRAAKSKSAASRSKALNGALSTRV